jgi:purine catabolism regulator
MPTLDELRAVVLPGARALGDAALDREIGWVRVLRARVPALDALERGDVAIVPAAALAHVAPGRAELDALVAALTAAPAGGVILVEPDDDEPVARAAMASFEGAVTAAGLPAVRATREDPVALERSVVGFLVNRRAEVEHQSRMLEDRLEALALAGAGPEGLVAAVADRLGRAIALEGARGTLIALHAPPAADDAAAAVAAYHAGPRSVALRVALPGVGGPAGSLALLGGKPPSELERHAADRIAALLALELDRDDAVRRARDTSGRAETLPAGGPPWIVLVARQRTGNADDTTERREALRRELRRLAPARRMTLRGDAESLELRAVLAVDEGDPDGGALAGRIGQFLRRTVAVSRAFADPADRPAAEADARSTLEAAEQLPVAPSVARADRLAAIRLLGNLHNLPDGGRLARSLLEPVLAGRPDVRREHLDTLRAILDHAGVAEAAAALGVHRNTVAYRLRRIEQLTGWHLGDPDLRLALSIALRFVQTAQVDDREPASG